MEGNIGEIQLGIKRELYKYINHYTLVIKASSKIILVQEVYIIFAFFSVYPFSAHLPSQRPVYFFATVPAME